jgi:hypothetical protein
MARTIYRVTYLVYHRRQGLKTLFSCKKLKKSFPIAPVMYCTTYLVYLHRLEQPFAVKVNLKVVIYI